LIGSESGQSDCDSSHNGDHTFTVIETFKDCRDVADGFKIKAEAATANVCFGSKADIEARQSDVRFTPKSGHWRARP